MPHLAGDLDRIVGIEKVIPRFADLEVLLQTLPRSATGERMNPTTPSGLVWFPAMGPKTCTSYCSTMAAPAFLRDAIGAPDAAVHPLRRVPERLPGLSAERRACLRLGVRRPDRGDPDAAARRHASMRSLCRLRLRCAARATKCVR